MKRILTILILCYALVFNLACPKRTDLEKWNSASETVAKYSRQGSNIAFGLYEQTVISLETKNKIFDAFIYLDEGGVKFSNFVKGQIKNGDIPKPVLDQIKAALRADVVDRFLDVLEKLKLLKLSESMRATITAIKTAVLIFADALDIRSEIKSKIELKEAFL